MVERVIDELVSVGGDPPHEIGIALRPAARESETRRHLVPGEQIENLRCIAGIAPGVERQRDAWPGLYPIRQHQRGRARNDDAPGVGPAGGSPGRYLEPVSGRLQQREEST